jgi:hypothetical protein
MQHLRRRDDYERSAVMDAHINCFMRFSLSARISTGEKVRR